MLHVSPDPVDPSGPRDPGEGRLSEELLILLALELLVQLKNKRGDDIGKSAMNREVSLDPVELKELTCCEHQLHAYLANHAGVRLIGYPNPKQCAPESSCVGEDKKCLMGGSTG